MRHILTFFLLVVWVPALWGNIEIQIRRLEYVQDLIERRKDELDRTQQQKGRLSEKKLSIQRRLQEALREIKNLTREEYQAVESIINRQHDIDDTQRKIRNRTALFEKQLERFVINKYTSDNHKDRTVEEYFMPLILEQICRNILETTEQLAEIETALEQEKGRRQHIHTRKKTEQNKSVDLEREINYLSTVIDSLFSEELVHLEELETLEQNQQALENLITQLQSDREQLSYTFTNDELLWPIKGEVTTPFGEIRDETHNLVFKNNGINISSDKTQQVRAVDFGIVVFAETFRNYGRMVVIDHRNGYYSLYAHNSSLQVTKGDTVSLGEAIAITGRRNNQDGYTLHFELRRGNKPVDPLDYLEAQKTESLSRK